MRDPYVQSVNYWDIRACIHIYIYNYSIYQTWGHLGVLNVLEKWVYPYKSRCKGKCNDLSPTWIHMEALFSDKTWLALNLIVPKGSESHSNKHQLNHSFVASLGFTIQNGSAQTYRSREAPTQMRLVAIEEPNTFYWKPSKQYCKLQVWHL